MLEIPKVHKLLQWALRQTSQGSIFLEGYLKNTDLLWRSSCIKFRISDRQLCTSSGSVYELVGAIDAKTSLLHGISRNLVDAFWNGFPEDWKVYLNCDLTKKKPDVTDMELQTTRFNTSTFTRTRSGRIVIPRLASWRGERIIWQKNGDFYISSGFLEALEGFSEESVSSKSNRLRKPQYEKKAVVTSAPEAQRKCKPHFNHHIVQHDNDQLKYSKETVLSTAVVQKKDCAPKTKLNSSRINIAMKESPNLASRRCLRKFSCSANQERTISTADANFENKGGRPLANYMASQSMPEEHVGRVTKQRSQPVRNVKVLTNNENCVKFKPVLRTRETLSKSYEKKSARYDSLQEKSVLTLFTSSHPEKRARDKIPSKTKSAPTKSVKRKCMYDDPLPKRGKRNNEREKPVLAISKKRNLVLLGKARKKPEPTQERNTYQKEIIRKISALQRKAATPEHTQEKSINRDKIIRKKPAVCKLAPSHGASKLTSVGNADLPIDDSCLILTPCARAGMGSDKSTVRPGSSKMLARPGTLRYEEDIRRFIREHNQDDDDDFLETTPFRAKVPNLHISDSFLQKVRKDNDDDDIINMLTPKSIGGLPSPFTPKKTPDFSGGVIGQLVQPLNMKHIDQLVYRINKRKKRNPKSFPLSAQKVMNKAATPVLPKLSASMEHYLIEALSDPESGDDEDKDYYFSDEENA